MTEPTIVVDITGCSDDPHPGAPSLAAEVTRLLDALTIQSLDAVRVELAAALAALARVGALVDTYDRLAENGSRTYAEIRRRHAADIRSALGANGSEG